MASNSSTSSLPSLPPYTLEPLDPVLPGVPDKYLTLVLPIVAYWLFSGVFHLIDTYDLFPQYRLHTPAEILKRNHVSRWDVFRDVVIQQIVQTLFGLGLAWAEPDQMTGQDDYNIAIWARRLRTAQRALPGMLAVFGINAPDLAQKMFANIPSIAGLLSGGNYSAFTKMSGGSIVPQHAPWELLVAKTLYWFLVPALQFFVGVVIVDTWQYFLHRGMHMNKWLYTTFHARHHRLYVPYAYGALYNHPLEGFTLDTLGTGLAYLLTGMTPRQSMWFFTGSTCKTVDDHCGYALPWDPLQFLTSNNAGYHDVHHQSWGIKTNFSQPFSTFWDRLLGTVWTGGDVSARYERARIAAEKKAQKDVKPPSSITGSTPIDSILDPVEPYTAKVMSNAADKANKDSLPQPPAGKATKQALESREQILYTQRKAGGGSGILDEETAEEEKELKRTPTQAQKGTRKATTSSSQAGSLKGLRDRVSGGTGFHGRTGSMLGYETGR